MNEETSKLSASFRQVYGRDTSGGMQILDFIVRKVLINMEKWKGETELLEETCKVILALSVVHCTSAALIGSLMGHLEL